MNVPFTVAVEAEEEVYRYQPADNGAGPMWCHGNTSIVRVGDQVFASGLETLPGAKPLNNCVPLLFRRNTGGNFLLEILPGGAPSQPVPVPLAQPLGAFFTATERGGCAPSDTLDVLGEKDHTLRYARLRIA